MLTDFMSETISFRNTKFETLFFYRPLNFITKYYENEMREMKFV